MKKVFNTSLHFALIVTLFLYLSACSNDENEKPKAEKPDPAQVTQPDEISEQPAASQEHPVAEANPTESTVSKPMPEPEIVPAAPQPMSDQERMLTLAKKSGCLACHSVDKKLVGPAWKEVAARYKNIETARSQLIEKVAKGGKGNWADITGDVPMPPYHPRVTMENIEQLVDFVLSLQDK